jgi:hypothetical protein
MFPSSLLRLPSALYNASDSRDAVLRRSCHWYRQVSAGSVIAKLTRWQRAVGRSNSASRGDYDESGDVDGDGIVRSEDVYNHTERAEVTSKILHSSPTSI